jgi:hypothetical protein
MSVFSLVWITKAYVSVCVADGKLERKREREEKEKERTCLTEQFTAFARERLDPGLTILRY